MNAKDGVLKNTKNDSDLLGNRLTINGRIYSWNTRG